MIYIVLIGTMLRQCKYFLKQALRRKKDEIDVTRNLSVNKKNIIKIKLQKFHKIEVLLISLLFFVSIVNAENSMNFDQKDNSPQLIIEIPSSFNPVGSGVSCLKR